MREDPVKDIHINSKTSIEDLILQFGEAGGFVASKISTATSIMRNMQLIPEKEEKADETNY